MTEHERELDDIICFACKRKPDEIPEYVEQAALEGTLPVQEAVADGTFNWETRHFCCTGCYISLGRPSSLTGWKAP